MRVNRRDSTGRGRWATPTPFPSPREPAPRHSGIPSTMPQIQYPVALDGRVAVTVQAAVSGRSYRCPGCAERMVARQGARRQWHFAHHRAVTACEPDRALHQSAQALIATSLEAALREGTRYQVLLRCPACGERQARNLAQSGSRVECEATIVPRVRTDVAIVRDSAPSIAIEVVVTHSIEPETHQRYTDAGIAVIVVEPSWDTLPDLRCRIVPARTLNVPPWQCASCTAAEERRAAAQRRAEALLRRLDDRVPHRGEELPFKPWREDRFERTLRPWVRARTHAGALILRELGFRQARAKPWLFLFELERGRTLFVNYGSTGEIPIWEDTAGVLFWSFQVESAPEEESAIIAGVLQRCRDAGVDLRVDFYRSSFDPDRPDRPVDPRRFVDRAVLARLLR